MYSLKAKRRTRPWTPNNKGHTISTMHAYRQYNHAKNVQLAGVKSTQHRYRRSRKLQGLSWFGGLHAFLCFCASQYHKPLFSFFKYLNATDWCTRHGYLGFWFVCPCYDVCSISFFLFEIHSSTVFPPAAHNYSYILSHCMPSFYTSPKPSALYFYMNVWAGEKVRFLQQEMCQCKTLCLTKAWRKALHDILEWNTSRHKKNVIQVMIFKFIPERSPRCHCVFDIEYCFFLINSLLYYHQYWILKYFYPQLSTHLKYLQ